ncbi:MAG: NUDIX domain-containing protein [Bosea sp. (in: a-proteobacteria)]
MSEWPDGLIVDLERIDARISAYDWAFSRESRAEIDAYWLKRSAGNPAMFNGRVLLQHAASMQDGVFAASYFETDYSDFLAWLQMGVPGTSPRNGFAMAALRANDGGFILGQMAQNTANPGRVYFAAGTPDLYDVNAAGEVDLAGSVLRELAEETGLRADEVSVGQGWKAVFANKRIAFMRPVSIDLPAEAARALMLERMKNLHEEELSGIVIIRSMADCAKHDMPPFMIDYLRHMFA